VSLVLLVQLTKVGCAAVEKLRCVAWLEACGGVLCDGGVALLATMTQLTYLSLAQNRDVTSGAYGHPARLQQLRSLNISGTGMDGPAPEFLEQLSQLTSLSMYGLKPCKTHKACASFSAPDVIHRIKIAGAPAPHVHAL
jgi:hypothetical protein